MALCAPALACPQDMIMESSLKGEIELGGAQKLRDADGGRSDLQVDELRQEFVDVLKTRELFLTEGAILERIRRDSGIPLDRHVAHASLLYSEKGRQALSGLWREYIEIARVYDTPIMICTPTWRANSERLECTSLPSVVQVSIDAVRLLTDIRSGYGEFERRFL